MRFSYLLFSFLLSVLWPSGLAAQLASHRLFTVLDGLAQQQVIAITKDSRGYLWVGTKGG